MSKTKTSTAQLAIEYVKKNPSIETCLQNELINYSSLSRLIAKKLELKNQTSIDAILISLRRYQKELTSKKESQKPIENLLKNSDIEIKNKIVRFVVSKQIEIEKIFELQKQIKTQFGLFYVFEGSDNYTIITQEKYFDLCSENFIDKIIYSGKDLAFVMINSPPEIEEITGVISYITRLFSDYNVNALEILSFWKDTFIVIEKKDIQKVLEFLEF